MAFSTQGAFMDPRAVTTHFHLREGDVVADFGAGAGFYLTALSAAVGNEGKVYACDIQKVLVDRLTNKIHEERLTNVHPVWCDLEEPGGTKLRDGLLDVGLLINTLFQIQDKATALKEFARVIRKGGKFFVVDWQDSFGGLGPHPSSVVPVPAARELVEAHGFAYERDFPTADHHYGLAFRRV
jgi:ubiquinone/menaquinone biosynthesis C-methylase UbiE